MTLTQLIEDKAKEVQSVKESLERLTTNLEKHDESIPPLWSGDLKQLNKFVNDLEDWVKSPKVNRAKHLIDIIKKQGNDKRSFKGLSEQYLSENQMGLEDAEKLVESLQDDLLRHNVAGKILDHLISEDVISSSVKTIGDFCSSLSQFIDEPVDKDFLHAIKEDLVTSQSTLKDLSPERIDESRETIKKAKEAFDLLKGSGITEEAYLACYMKSKSVEVLWDYANNVRELLNEANIAEANNSIVPLNEIKRINAKKNQCLKKANLSEVDEGLQEISERIKKWRGQIRESFSVEYEQTRNIVEMAELGIDLDELSSKFESIVDTFTDTQEVADIYLEMKHVKDEALKTLEAKIKNPIERKIIENMNKANDLVEEMDEEFWEALQSLRKKGLIKIRLERGT